MNARHRLTWLGILWCRLRGHGSVSWIGGGLSWTKLRCNRCNTIWNAMRLSNIEEDQA